MSIFSLLIVSLSYNITSIDPSHNVRHLQDTSIIIIIIIIITIIILPFLPSIRMSGKSINIGEKNNKSSFYKNKKPFKIDDIDIDKILVSKKESYRKENSLKYFIGYNYYDDVIRPLCIRLPQMIGYVKCFDNNKTMYFKVSDNKLLKKYNKIWEKISNLMNIEFDSEPFYGDNDEYVKTKIKLYGDKINTNFQDKKKYQKKMHHISAYH